MLRSAFSQVTSGAPFCLGSTVESAAGSTNQITICCVADGPMTQSALRDKRRSKPVACQAIASNSAPKKQHHNLGKVVADDAAHWQNAKQGVYHNRHKGRHRRANRHGDPPKAHPNHSAHGHSRPQLKQAGRQQRHHQRKQQRPQGNINPLGPAQRFILHKQHPLAKFSIIVYGIL